MDLQFKDKLDIQTFMYHEREVQTAIPHIYAAGDVIEFPALSSTSMEQGRQAVTHAFRFNYRLAQLFRVS
jgi:pyruvate/2-oxoglutarate dehydrogenase complex dihydrolipoamide dehydrogenase (E3) component